MATTRLALLLIAKNMAKRELAGFQRSLKSTTSTMKRFGTAALGMVGLASAGMALKSVTKAALIQETAVQDLSAALRNNGDEVKSNVAELKKFAAGIQQATIYGDEAILSQLAYARNLGITEDKLQDAARAAVGLAAKYRLDLATAMQLIGRASQGQTSALTRYGIVLDEALTESEKFNEVLRIGGDAFGLAEDAAKSSEGQLIQYQNALGDLKEEWGEGLLPVMLDFLAVMKKINDTVPKAKQGVRDVLKGAGIMAPVVSIKNPLAGPSAPGWGSVIEQVRNAPKADSSQKDVFGASMHQEQLTQIEKYEEHKLRLHSRSIKRWMAEQDQAKEATRRAAEETARMWESVGHTMEYSMTNAFDRIVWEAGTWKDAMTAILRDVGREMSRQFIFAPMSQNIMGMFGLGSTPAPAAAPVTIQGSRQSGGYIPQTGLYKLHAGEEVTRKGGGNMNITLKNESGIPLRMTDPQISDKEIVVGLLLEDYDQGGPTYDRFGGGR